MMVLSDTISVMLLTHPFYATFTRKPIADAQQQQSGAAVHFLRQPGGSRPDHGGGRRRGRQDRRLARRPDEGRADVRPRFRRSGRPSLGADVDGPGVRRQGRAPGRRRRRSVTFEDGGIMPVDQFGDRDHRLPLGSRLRAGLVRDLRLRWALEEIGPTLRVRLDPRRQARRIFLRAAVGPGSRTTATVRSSCSRAARSSSRPEDERLLPSRSEGRASRNPVGHRGAEQRRAGVFPLLINDCSTAASLGEERRPKFLDRLERLKRTSRHARRQGMARGRALHHRRFADGDGPVGSSATKAFLDEIPEPRGAGRAR